MNNIKDKKYMYSKRGFTFIGILLIIVSIGIVVGVSITLINTSREDSKVEEETEVDNTRRDTGVENDRDIEGIDEDLRLEEVESKIVDNIEPIINSNFVIGFRSLLRNNITGSPSIENKLESPNISDNLPVQDPSLPEINLSLTPTEVLEDGSTNLEYKFTRSGDLSQAISINYSIAGIAINGEDYDNISNTVQLGAGESEVSVIVNPKADSIFEPDETVIISLATGTGYNVGVNNSVEGKIKNDDSEINLSLTPTEVNENGATNLEYKFTRSGDLSQAISINYSIGGTAINGEDYDNISNTVQLGANESEVSVIVNPKADSIFEPDETVTITIEAGTGYNVGVNNSVEGKIKNDDSEINLSLTPTEVLEDGSTNLEYKFTRTGDLSQAITINYSIGGTAINGEDYESIGTTVQLGANESEVSVIVNPKADNVMEPDETVIISLATGTGYNVGVNNSVEGKIKNDDIATGIRDASFDTGVPVGFNNDVRTLALQSDGKIIVGGLFTSYQGQPAASLIRVGN
jgi:putative heme iron utilization protein